MSPHVQNQDVTAEADCIGSVPCLDVISTKSVNGASTKNGLADSAGRFGFA